MTSMKTDLQGLFNNIVSELPMGKRDYYRQCLNEVVGHLQGVHKGWYTFPAFVDFYCMGEIEEEKVPRVESGVVQIESDWPGVFIRGDDCAMYAAALHSVVRGQWANELEHRVALSAATGLQQTLQRSSTLSKGHKVERKLIIDRRE